MDPSLSLLPVIRSQRSEFFKIQVIQDKSKMAYAVIDSTECFSLVQDSKIVHCHQAKLKLRQVSKSSAIATSKNNVHRKVS